MTPAVLWNSSNQPAVRRGRFRRLLLNIHLWLGLGVAVLLVPVSLSGALLVWKDGVDALLHPSRYAVTKGQAQPPTALLAGARTSFGDDLVPTMLRLPDEAGWPATVLARGQRRAGPGAEGGGGPPRLVTAYIDPATARVLDVVEFRTSLMGFLHRFHENLAVPEYSGRAVVGWSGVVMLVISLSGIYLWWPRNAGFLRGLRWRRGPTMSFNLHHTAGFWISVPLALVSATGIYLGFPQQGRELLSSVAPMTPQQRGGFNAPLLAKPQLDADRVLAIALDGAAGAKALAVALPTQANGAWRIQLRGAEGETTVLVDDRTGVRGVVVPLSGDRVAQWLRWIHEGSHLGLVWRIVVLVCGILPTLFVVTGAMIWLRSRKARATDGNLAGAQQLEAAE